MIAVRSVAQVRAAEEVAFTQVPEGALMQRAAHALAITCARLLDDAVGGVAGTRVVLLVGSGNNGGDALWAGQRLAGRGCRVDAITLSDRLHEEGARALVRAGGRVHRWTGDDDERGLLADAHLVIDGILGIGGTGGLRPDAADVAESVANSGALVVAVDVPSGVDADTGVVDGAAIAADVTVTFGAVKPGLLLAPGRFRAGTVSLIDIGLEFDGRPDAVVLAGIDVDRYVPEPVDADYKYSRGVVGISAGSAAYPGACLMATGGARHGNAGMVRFLDRSDGAAAMVLDHFPDVVVDGAAPSDQPHVTAWGCGSGFTGDATDVLTVRAVLSAPVPVVLDAGALTIVGESEEIRAVIAERAARGLPTVLTPHQGEFERLLPGLLTDAPGRLDAARRGAQHLQASIVLKGAGTVVACPSGAAAIDTEGTADLGTAGSGDVLMGLLAALLAGAWARGVREPDLLNEAMAAAVWLHGRAGRQAAESGPVTALDVEAALKQAVLSARFGDPA
jgi:hydroxyethylthiazole kinase-like uncharacterized protein yjeF